MTVNDFLKKLRTIPKKDRDKELSIRVRVPVAGDDEFIKTIVMHNFTVDWVDFLWTIYVFIDEDDFTESRNIRRRKVNEKDTDVV